MLHSDTIASMSTQYLSMHLLEDLLLQLLTDLMQSKYRTLTCRHEGTKLWQKNVENAAGDRRQSPMLHINTRFHSMFAAVSQAVMRGCVPDLFHEEHIQRLGHWHLPARDHAQQRGLALAVGAYQPVAAPGRDRQRCGLQEYLALRADCQIMHLHSVAVILCTNFLRQLLAVSILSTERQSKAHGITGVDGYLPPGALDLSGTSAV